MLTLAGTTRSVDFVLKSEIESEEEEDLAEEDEELEETQDEATGSLMDMHVKFKPPLLDQVEAAQQGKISEQKSIDERLLSQDKMDLVPKDAKPQFNLLQMLQDDRNLR